MQQHCKKVLMRKTILVILTLSVMLSLSGCGEQEESFASNGNGNVELLTGITITTPPATIVYDSGNTFDPTGMVVTASYSTGRTAIVSDYSVIDGDKLRAGTTKVTISYQGKTVVQPVEVNPAELQILISVKRTGNLLTGIGKMSVLIDDEEIFEVSNNSTESAKITMAEGVHTIQTKGQGDKSKKVEFEVVNGEPNEFFFTSEISDWWGVTLERMQYLVEE